MELIAENIILNNFLDNVTNNNDSKIGNQLLKLKKRKFKRRAVICSLFNEKRNIPKCNDVWTTISNYQDDIFHSHFRMDRNSFKKLCDNLLHVWNTHKIGRPPYSIDKCLYLTLWKLANQCSFREISDHFGIGRGSTYLIFKKTVLGLSKLKKSVIKWPSNEIQLKKISEEFEFNRKNPFPQVIGCIDGTHFNIRRPNNSPESYYNRKGTYSIIMQGICDSKLRFLDVFVGYPGRCHDACVFKDSPIYKAISTGEIKIPRECHFLGDSAYPLETYLVPPYRDNGYLTPEQKRFNFIHSSNRVHIEQAFGILKKKFRILNCLPIQKISLAKHIIMACVVLHNFIINEGCPTEYFQIPDVDVNQEEFTESSLNDTQNEEAKRKRERLTMLFSA